MSRKRWFTSDLHFGHQNVIELCNRPFNTVESMNAALVANWNRLVGMQDEIYILGDLSFMTLQDTTQILIALNGQKILVWGNHDNRYRKSVVFREQFIQVEDYLEISVPGDFDKPQHIVMCHYPILSWNRMRYGSWMLHGHTHGNIDEQNVNKKRYDVGVDANGYAPVSYDEIFARI